MSINRRLQSIIGWRFPASYDASPQEPPQRTRTAYPEAEVDLSPPPRTPQELGAAVADELVHAAWLAERLGLDPGLAFDDPDDWCPTVPQHLRLPPWWPPTPGPDPDPSWLADFHLGLAARLVAAQERVDKNSPLGVVLSNAMLRSLAAMEGRQGVKGI